MNHKTHNNTFGFKMKRILFIRFNYSTTINYVPITIIKRNIHDCNYAHKICK